MLTTLPTNVLVGITKFLSGAIVPLWLSGDSHLQQMLCQGGVTAVNLSSDSRSVTLQVPACMSTFLGLSSICINRHANTILPLQLWTRDFPTLHLLEEITLIGSNAENMAVSLLQRLQSLLTPSSLSVAVKVPLTRLVVESRDEMLKIEHLKFLLELKILEIRSNSTIAITALPLLPRSLTRLVAPESWNMSSILGPLELPPRLKSLTSSGTVPSSRFLSRLPQSLTELVINWSSFTPTQMIFLPIALTSLDLKGVTGTLKFQLQHLHLPLLRSACLPDGVDMTQPFTLSDTTIDLSLQNPINWSGRLKTHFRHLQKLSVLCSSGIFDSDLVDALPSSLRSLSLKGTSNLTDKALSTLPEGLEKISIEKSLFTSAGLASLPIGIAHMEIGDMVDGNKFPTHLQQLIHVDLCGGRFFSDSLPPLPSSVTHLSLSQNCHLTSSVFALLPRALESLIFKVPEFYPEVKGEDLDSLPRCLSSLVFLGPVIINDSAIALLPRTMQLLDMGECSSLTGSSFGYLPRFLSTLVLRNVTSAAAEDLKALPRSLTNCNISSATHLADSWLIMGPPNAGTSFDSSKGLPPVQ